MSENEQTFGGQGSLKDLYPVLVGFGKAILPDTEVALNIDKRLYEDKYVSLLVPGGVFVATDRLNDGSGIGTLVQINSVRPKEDAQTFLGHSMLRVKLDDVAFFNDIPFAFASWSIKYI